MKLKKIILGLVITVILYSCDPHLENNGYSNYSIVSINARVLNNKDTFNIGDTIKFYFESTDSIIFNGNTVKLNITNNDAAYLQPSIGYADTSESNFGGYGGVTNGNKCNFIAPTGSYSNRRLTFANYNNKFIASFYIIPLEKGAYFIDEVFYGQLTSDNAINVSKLHFNFGSVNRHFNYILDNLKPSQAANMLVYLSTRGENKTNEFFAFYVK